MRFYGLALLASATVLGACGGGENKGTDTSKAPAPAATSTNPTAAAPTPAAGAVAKVAATGATHDVKMIGDAQGYRFDPSTLTIKSGDAVRFTMIAGGPHNVTFDPSIPADAKAQLDANMDNKSGDLAGPMLLNPNDTYVISFGGVKPGTYPFFCSPHQAMNMKGTITVQ